MKLCLDERLIEVGVVGRVQRFCTSQVNERALQVIVGHKSLLHEILVLTWRLILKQ